jgi:hypothetical protein
LKKIGKMINDRKKPKIKTRKIKKKQRKEEVKLGNVAKKR